MENVINDDLKFYLDLICSELISEIVVKYGVDEDEVFVGNGFDEVLVFLFMIFFFREKKILFLDISYIFYKVYFELFKLNYELVKLDDDFNILLDEFKKFNGGIIIFNFNVFIGKYIDIENLRNLIEVNKESVVIIDEVYVDFGGEFMVKFIKDY